MHLYFYEKWKKASYINRMLFYKLDIGYLALLAFIYDYTDTSKWLAIPKIE